MELLKKSFKSLIIGSLVGLSIALFTRFFFQDVIDRLEYVTYYMRYRWNFADLSKEKLDELQKQEYGIHIIDIDDRSMQKMGLYWNWDRSYHAELISVLNTRFPAAIVFDILFHEPEDRNHRGRLEKLLMRSQDVDPTISLSENLRSSIISTIDYDKSLIKATLDAGSVFHGICLSDESDYKDFALSQVKHKMTMAWHDSLNPNSAVVFPEEKRKTILEQKPIIDGIFPELAQAAKGIGHVDVVPNEDGVIREIPLFYSFGKNSPTYLPISVRVAATLFGTPNEEIHFEPGSHIDLGKPFKVYKDSSSKNLTFSYPNLTKMQAKLIHDRGPDILKCQIKKTLDISSFLLAQKDSANNVSLEMNIAGVIPHQIVDALLNTDLKTALTLKIGEEYPIAPEITIARDSETDWVIRAPFDAEEWWFTELDIQTLARVKTSDLTNIPIGKRVLLFHNFYVRNVDGLLVSSVPVLRGVTLKEFLACPWNKIEELSPGTRMDFGDNVRIPLLPNNHHIITFFGPKAKPFPPYSYYDILTNRIKAPLEGKIFVVGSTAPALFDIKAVPHDRSYPAVEIHASLLNSFLTNTFVRRLAVWQDFFILLVVGIIIGFVSYMFKPLAGAILTFTAVLCYFLTAMTLFGSELIWIEIARPILTLLITFTVVMAYRYITEEKDRKFLQSTFKQYLSPELIDIMYKQKKQPQLGGEEGIRTAFFTDIQGFSTFSEKLGSPTRLVELLNEYLSEMTDILLARYGTLDKYEGDAIIAFFGAPMPLENHAQQACAAALDMQSKLGDLRKKWISEGDKWPTIVHEMRMRIGINTGPITTGNMGSKVRMNYTMMGDAVNLAARLESAAKQYGVYTMISHFTADMVKNDFEIRQLDKITVVGKSEPVTVYELIAPKNTLSQELKEFYALYEKGIEAYYAQEWDKAIEILTETEKKEPYRDISSKGISPSMRILQYCNDYKENPPGENWDGVSKLTSK